MFDFILGFAVGFLMASIIALFYLDRERKAARRFRIKCDTCGKGFNSYRDYQDHLVETGH